MPVVADFSRLVCPSVLSPCSLVPTGVLWQCSVHCFPEFSVLVTNIPLWVPLVVVDCVGWTLTL